MFKLPVSTALTTVIFIVVGCSSLHSPASIETVSFEEPVEAKQWAKPDADGTDVKLRPAPLASLSGWREDNALAALPALSKSCGRFLWREPHKPVGSNALGGSAGDWKRVCSALKDNPPQTKEQARAFFEKYFAAYQVVSDTGKATGTFTGYYTAHVFASETKSDRYPYPLYAKPETADQLSGKDGFSRKSIEQGALKGKGLEVLWVSNPVDAFILHVQGSGIATMEDGRKLTLTYAGNNGHKFKGLLTAMKKAGYDPKRDGQTMTAFAQWLKSNPVKAEKVMWANPRYIFFKVGEEPGAIGAMGLPLTATRSMAVDPAHIPLGVPMWLQTSFMDHKGKTHKIERLMVAQDTGNAIKGIVRGDFYWGAGTEAGWAASRMKNKGSYYMLLPKHLDLTALLVK